MTITATAARRILRRQGMPPQEIRAVLADDPVVAQRILELHRERLSEWLEQQRSMVEGIERSLAGPRDLHGRRAVVPSTRQGRRRTVLEVSRSIAD